MTHAWSASLPTSSSSLTPWHRRLAVVAIVITLAVLVPAHVTRAAAHREDIDLVVDVAGFGDVSLDPIWERDVGDAGASLHAFGGRPGTELERLRVLVLDACRPAGRTYLYGANPSELAMELRPTVADMLRGAGLQLLPGSPAAPRTFGFVDPFDCGVLTPDPPARLPRLTGVARFRGLTRVCSDFSAPFAFGQSRRGRPYDRLTLRGNQRNRIIDRNPLTTVDQSATFDELYYFDLLDIADAVLPESLRAVVIGGGKGTLPKADRLTRLLRRLDQQARAELVGATFDRAAAGKVPQPLLKAVRAGKNACTYDTAWVFDDGLDEAALWTLLESLDVPPAPVAVDPRFRVDVERADGTDGSLTPLEILARPDTPGDVFWFFADDDWETLVQVLDGCPFNDHFWVFAAAASGVELTIEVTDLASAEIRRFEPSPIAEPILDVEAIATCP